MNKIFDFKFKTNILLGNQKEISLIKANLINRVFTPIQKYRNKYIPNL